MAMLDVKNISKSFGATRVLEDISFSLEQGETVAVIGASGHPLLRRTHFRTGPGADRGSAQGHPLPGGAQDDHGHRDP